jgi:hypothetical protein
MSIQAIADLFDVEVKKVRPKLSVYDYDVFGNNPIDSVQMRKHYNLIITEFEIVEEGNFRYRIYKTILDLWSIKGINFRSDYYALVDDAEQIQENLINPKTVDKCIRRIEPTDYVAEEEPDSESAFKIRLNFDVYVGI